MKYVILIRHNPKARELWASMPAEQRAEGLAAYAALTEDLVASGSSSRRRRWPTRRWPSG